MRTQLREVTTGRTKASIRAEIHAKVYCVRAARKSGDDQAIELLHDQINVLLDQLEDAR